MKELYTLTANEVTLMNIFWDNDAPMTSVDAGKVLPEWKNNGYLHSTIKSLVLKGYLTIVNSITQGRHSIKVYQPCITKEEYAARLLLPLKLDENSIPELSMCLLRNHSKGSNRDLFAELEKIYTEFVASHKEELHD